MTEQIGKEPVIQPRVTVWLDFIPEGSGSGADLRFYSNLRAFLDLGFDLQLVVVPHNALRPVSGGRMGQVTARQVRLQRDPPGVVEKLAYRAGITSQFGFRYAFPGHRQLVAELRTAIRADPGMLHFIEGEHLASALPFVRSPRLIWSHHDSLPGVARAAADIAGEIGGRAWSRPERRAIRFAVRAERRMVKAAPLVLTISDADRERIARTSSTPVATLPMSVPDEDPYRLTEGFPSAPKPLRLLHLGRTAHLPSYRSLEFLLAQVLPALPPQVLGSLELLVAGDHAGRDARSERIRHLAARYPSQVRLLGFVDDLRRLTCSAHLQVVAVAEATGLRTRIIESFACGLPVLSTTGGAAGIIGLEAGRNIILADTVNQFSDALTGVATGKVELAALAREARDLYLGQYSREMVAKALEGILRQNRLYG